MTSTDRDFGVDLSRTLAITSVILVHSTGLGFGRFGVQLFFIISGYLLGDFYLRQNWFQFISHRAFRLFPLSIFFIILFYRSNFTSLPELIINILLIQNFLYFTYSFPGGWSISNEWIFSLFLIVLIPKYKKYLLSIFIFICLTQIITGLYAFALGGANFSDGINDYRFKTWMNTLNPFINFGFFLSGILIMLHKNRLIGINKKLLFLLPVLMIWEDHKIGHLMIGWQFALPAVFILCLESRTENRSLTRVIHFLGKRTYGIFFVHFLVWDYIQKNIANVDNFFTNVPVITKLISFLLIFGFSVVGGTLTYKFIEKPFLKLSKQLFND